MPYRTPRGYEVNRPQYQELSQGIRPEVSAIPQEAYSGLPPVRIDQVTHDPIVLDAGVVIGIASGGLADGKLFPAHSQTGTITLLHHSDGASWGLPAGGTVSITGNAVTGGPVLPLGMIYQPIYSFMLQKTFSNYKRTDNVGFVTDYLIQIPATTAAERAIKPGQMVMPNIAATTYGQVAAGAVTLGSLQAWDNSAATLKNVIGRCFNILNFADSSNNTANNLYDAEFALGATTLTTDGDAEFKGLNRVQTVPGMGLAGSGTGGIPAWLTKAQSDGSGGFFALTILVRL